MEALRVVFSFANLVSVSDSPLHLDGLMAWAAVERARRNGETDLDRAAETLPLSRQGDPAVWCASALQFEYLTPPSFLVQTRTTDFHDYAAGISDGRIALSRPRDQINLGSGPLRNHLVSYVVRQASHATAWCIGDADKVKSLLSDLRHVGRLGRMGYGELTGFTVDADAKANEMWKLRHLPWPEKGYLPCLGNFRAPYWDKARMTEVFAPPVVKISVNERPPRAEGEANAA